MAIHEKAAARASHFNVADGRFLGTGANSGSESFNEFSSVWKSVTSSVRGMVERKEHIVLIGERGVGKEKLVRGIVCDVHPGVTVIDVEPGLIADDVKADLCSNGKGTSYLILRHLERWTTDEMISAHKVISDISSRGNPVGVAAIVTEAESSESEEDTFHRSFHGLFGRSIQVPPLRHRMNDLPCLVYQMLSEISGTGVSEVSNETLEKLSAYFWPGNLTELRHVLSECLSKKPSGMIEVEDLPASIRLSSIHASGILEHLEREAIVKSLEENDGNRMRTAKSLGIARSSLYRKMKIYKI